MPWAVAYSRALRTSPGTSSGPRQDRRPAAFSPPMPTGLMKRADQSDRVEAGRPRRSPARSTALQSSRWRRGPGPAARSRDSAAAPATGTSTWSRLATRYDSASPLRTISTSYAVCCPAGSACADGPGQARRRRAEAEHGPGVGAVLEARSAGCGRQRHRETSRVDKGAWCASAGGRDGDGRASEAGASCGPAASSARRSLAAFALLLRVGDRRGHLQPAGVLVRGSGRHLVRLADLDDLALVQDGDPVADLVDHAEVVADEQVRHAGRLLEVLEQAQDAWPGW